MTSMEDDGQQDGTSTAEEVPAGNPDELTKNPVALQEAHKQMATLDVLVCGQCHSAFHFVEEFKEHKSSENCTGKSPVRDSNESKAQVWAFLLWKCSSSRDGSVDNSWKLYQQWCRMAEAQRNAWIAAGTSVQSLSKFAHARVMEVKTDDQLVPVQTPILETKKRGRPKKTVKVEDSETQPSGEESDDIIANKKKVFTNKTPVSQAKPKDLSERESVRNAQERVPPEERIARRTEREGGDPAEAGEFVVEKILAKRFNPRRKQYEYLLKWEGYPQFNPRRKQYEYLLKWEGYPHDQNTWEPVENMETCKHLLEAFEKQLARQKEIKALRQQQQQQQQHPVQVRLLFVTRSDQNTWEPVENMETCKHLLEAFEKQLARQKEIKALRQQQQQQQQHPVQVKQINVPLPQVVKTIVKKPESPALTPTGRLQRSSKVRALDQVKAWCGAEEEPAAKRIKKEASSEDEDYSDPDTIKAIEKKVLNGQSSPKANLDPELVKSLGLGGKGMPNIKGVIKVDPKHMPNLTTGVYIMSKSSGIMKIDSPGKLGPGLNIDQDVIRKQILAAKQKKTVEELKKSSPVRTPVTQVKKTFGTGGQQVTERTITTPSGQKIIQRTIQRPVGAASDRSPVTILNKKLAQLTRPGVSQGDSLLRRGGGARGRGRGGFTSVSTAAGNIVRIREKPVLPVSFDFDQSDASSESDGIEDPFPRSLGPLPPPSPERPLSLCPLTGKRLARAEGEPTPPPTPSPPPSPSPPPPPATPPPSTTAGTMLMKVEMSPGGTTGMLVQGDAAQPSLPVLTDEDGTEVKVEAATVKQLLEGDDGEEVSLLHTGHPPIMIRGEDGVLYQVAGENEAGQTLLVAAEGVEGVEGAVEGEHGVDADGDGVMYVTRDDGQDVLSIDPSQLAQLMPGAGAAPLQQVAVQVEGEPGEDSTQVIAQLLQADLPSPGGTRRVVLMLPDGTLTMTELDKEQYESITEAGRAQE